MNNRPVSPVTHRRLERLIQIIDDVLRLLQTDTDSDQGVGDAQPRPILLIHRGVCHQAGQLRQRLITSQTLGQGDHLDGTEEGATLLQAALDVEAQHARAGRGLATGQFVLRVRGQTGVEDLLHGRVGLQELGRGERGGAVLTHAHGERLEGAVDEVAVEWRRYRANGCGGHRLVSGGFRQLKHSGITPTRCEI